MSGDQSNTSASNASNQAGQGTSSTAANGNTDHGNGRAQGNQNVPLDESPSVPVNALRLGPSSRAIVAALARFNDYSEGETGSAARAEGSTPNSQHFQSNGQQGSDGTMLSTTLRTVKVLVEGYWRTGFISALGISSSEKRVHVKERARYGRWNCGAAPCSS
ncbi:hypothetical protein K469DRAFT_684088 [Zopfia rhizophila CBS 207.26]|uniref:Uncharacterized protein n=1 Tax=Zopfia rhizophila CBS 207.26 TaxID=1314779 RepID=A0A6A6EA88_9PEZI|nr:hypothetical protein K469DRAFT_684088 [Zopfia rhizophila CBS 207.26]